MDFFLFLASSFLVVCIRNALGYCVVAEAGCNLYLRDINIYSLSKKYIIMSLEINDSGINDITQNFILRMKDFMPIFYRFI